MITLIKHQCMLSGYRGCVIIMLLLYTSTRTKQIWLQCMLEALVALLITLPFNTWPLMFIFSYVRILTSDVICTPFIAHYNKRYIHYWKWCNYQMICGYFVEHFTHVTYRQNQWDKASREHFILSILSHCSSMTLLQEYHIKVCVYVYSGTPV